MTMLSFVGGPFAGTDVEIDLPEPYRAVFLPQPKYSHERVPPVFIGWPGSCTISDALEFNMVVIREECPVPITQRQEMKPDTHTLEWPAGMSLTEALQARQVRLLREKPSRVLASVYLKINRYRNGDGSTWHFVPYA